MAVEIKSKCVCFVSKLLLHDIFLSTSHIDKCTVNLQFALSASTQLGVSQEEHPACKLSDEVLAWLSVSS